MEKKDIQKLLASNKPALINHALEIWEKEWSKDHSLLLQALKCEDSVIIARLAKLCAIYHPLKCSDALAGLLKHPESKIRRLVVENLNRKMGKVVENHLKNLLQKEKDVFVLASAVKAAARLNLPVDLIADFLGHKDVRLRANTVRAVAVTGRERMRNLLEPMLKDEAQRVQNEALRALAVLIPEDELKTLINKRINSAHTKQRAATTFLLGELSLPGKVGLLTEKLGDESNGVIICAVRALVNLQDPIGLRAAINLYLTSSNNELCDSLAPIIANVGQRLLNIAQEQNHPAKAEPIVIQRLMKVAGLIKNWESFLPWILACLRNCRPPERLPALKLIFKNISYFKHDLENLLQLPDTDLEETAFNWLCKFKAGNTGGLDELKTMLYSEKPAMVKAAVAALSYDNSLVCRNCLKQAADSGVILALAPQKFARNIGNKPIKLPEK